MARAALHEHPGHRVSAGYTTVTALTLLVLAGSYAVGNDSLTDLIRIADGVVLLPAWLVWAGRIGGIERIPPKAL